MSDGRHLPPGHIVTYPNREKAASKANKVIVVLLLLVSIALMLAVTFGGWSKLQGLTPVNFMWCFAYLAFAIWIARWARGLLPIAAALAILLLIVSLIAGLGGSGTSWFQRNHLDYAPAHSIFGGVGFSPDVIGLLVLVLAPVQALLIIFAMIGFSQGWNVEVEKHIDEVRAAKNGRGRATPTAAASH